jgi:PAS domain S-box-containing protein
MPLHALLDRQLRTLGLEPGGAPSQQSWAEMLEQISGAYGEADQARNTLERANELSGAEMRELYAALAREHAALLDKRKRIQAIFEHSAVGQAVIAESGVVSEANEALASMLGTSRSELVGRELLAWTDAADREQFAESLRRLFLGEQRELATDQHWQTKDGEALWVHLNLSLVEASGSQPGFVSLFVQNVTEHKRLEIELRHAQKLESVGRLAAGIAHEINTPVQFVGDNLPFLEEAAEANRKLRLRFRELLVRALEAGWVQSSEILEAEHDADIEYLDREVPRALAQTREGLERVTTIVRALKEFAHPDDEEHTRADLNRALASTITVARSEFSRVAEVQTDFGDIPLVLCNLGDLNQVFLNILVNAAHAVGDAIGTSGRLGLIKVSTARDGDAVVVTISDDGTGIPEHVQAHIFEPFFTTKEVGRGTGQGLAMSRSIVVDRHGGRLTFKTRPGEGTSFEIRLPVEANGPSGLPEVGRVLK